jgi:RNA polymerase sigma factor (sigma-70 family)
MSASRTYHVPTIIRDTGRRLMQFIRARVATDADAEDILQDVWGQLLESLQDGPIEQVASWLYTVARNRIIDGYRKPKIASLEAFSQDAAEDDLPQDLAEFLPLVAQSAKTEQWRDQFWDALHDALAELPPEQRQVFVWNELEDLSFQDIAALTGDNINTLLSRKRYAVLHLRQRLARWLDNANYFNYEVP